MKRKMKDSFRPLSGGAALLFAASMFIALLGPGVLPAQSSRSAAAGTYSVLYSFQCKPDGENPEAGLVRDSAGNLYGTTYNGGVKGFGSVFKVRPNGTETLLYSFSTHTFDAENPALANLILDEKGNLYGTTPVGGLHDSGAVFKVTADGKKTVLYNFTGNADGNEPFGGLVRDSAGNAYGTAFYGGLGTGVIFKLSPGGVESVLYNFGSQTSGDGNNPIGTLVRDSAGNLYGTTENGGAFGFGTVFKLAPDGTETILHSFAGFPNDGAFPAGVTLLRDAAGNLYGATIYGGAYDNSVGLGYGVVFKVTPSGTESVLLNFNGRGNGGYPVGLARGSSGNFFGTTEVGGSTSCNDGGGCGVLFELNSTGKETVLYKFGESSGDGEYPEAGVIRDSAGNLYGTTYGGGDYGCGTVFKYTP
ncbi:MAG TPA: choice-of-anchor tandem repeat GloVer-containing protein [Terriglobia bacterium]|nr:choice-of-anchor tandem repeat GloVer-containing protein [Terriglobia bacterium]